MRQNKYNFALVLLAAGLAQVASATTITFGTGGTTGFTGGGATVTVNNAAGVTGMTVVVTPGTTAGCTTCTIDSNGNGYGVTNSTADNSDAIDGSGVLDTITISFSRSVTLTGVTFGSWGNNDDAGIYNGATLVTTYSANGGTATVSTTGTSFQIRAVGADDDFRLRSIDFTVVSPTPEPATLGMMGVALLGIGFGARKRIKRG